MVTVYEVLTDDKYQYLVSTDSKAFLAHGWRFDGTPIEESWDPPEVYSREPRLKKPDIWRFFCTLAFEEQAAQTVLRCLYESGTVRSWRKFTRRFARFQGTPAVWRGCGMV